MARNNNKTINRKNRKTRKITKHKRSRKTKKGGYRYKQHTHKRHNTQHRHH